MLNLNDKVLRKRYFKMTLNYTFGGDDYHDGDDFEYELEISQIDDWFKSLPQEQLIEMLEEAFANMTEQEQSEIITELLDDAERNLTKVMKGTNSTYVPNFKNLLEDDFGWVVEVFLYDNLDDYRDELEDYFYDEASEAHSDYVDWSNDPYGGKWMPLGWYQNQ